MPLELDVRIHHDDRPPGALAHGAIKTSDIERVRGDVAEAERCVAGTAPAALARGGQSVKRRAELGHARPAATAVGGSAAGAPGRAGRA